MPDIEIVINGTPLRVPEGMSVLGALLRSGRRIQRRSISGEPRGGVCGMGVCHECRVEVDGRAHVRACLCECKPGMEVKLP